MDFMLNYGLGEFIPETNQVEIDIMGKMMRATVLEGPPVKTQPIREKEKLRGKQWSFPGDLESAGQFYTSVALLNSR